MPSGNEGGVERLIDRAERALASGDEARAHSLASQARVLNPGDPRIQKVFQAGVDARTRRDRLLLLLGRIVIVVALAAVGVAFWMSYG